MTEKNGCEGVAVIVFMITFLFAMVIISPVPLAMYDWVKYVGCGLLLVLLVSGFYLARSAAGRICLCLVLLCGFSCMCVYEGNSSFKEQFACVDRYDGKIYRKTGFYVWQNPIEPTLMCSRLEVNDYGLIAGFSYHAKLSMVQSDLTDNEFRQRFDLVHAHSTLFDTRRGERYFSDIAIETVERDVRKDARVFILHSQIKQCVAEAVAHYSMDIKSAEINARRLGSACDFSEVGLTFEALRIQQRSN